MRPEEIKSIRYRHMVKVRIVPILRIVAFQTGRRETTSGMLILIIGLMTTNAVVLIRRLEQWIEARRRRVARRAF